MDAHTKLVSATLPPTAVLEVMLIRMLSTIPIQEFFVLNKRLESARGSAQGVVSSLLREKKILQLTFFVAPYG